MKRLVNVLLLFIVSGVKCKSSTFKIPDAQIEAYEPRGIRITVPHVEGMMQVDLHANVNEPIIGLEPGQFTFSLNRFGQDWVFEDERFRLRVGDKLHYWIYAQHNRLGYRRDDEVVYDVQEVMRKPAPGQKPSYHFVATPTRRTMTLESVPSSSPSPTHEDANDDDLHTCRRTTDKLLQEFITLDGDCREVKRKNDLLLEVLESKRGTKELTLRSPVTLSDPIDVVRLVLNEKLDLQPSITSAVENSDGSITFTLCSVSEMLKVYSSFKERLANSKIISITL